MATEWLQGIGRYGEGGIYAVYAGRKLILSILYHQTMGSRTVQRNTDGILCLEADGDLPELVFTHGMGGYWELGDQPAQVFALELPEGGVLRRQGPEAGTPQPSTAVATTVEALQRQGFGFVKGPKRAVWYVVQIDDLPYVIAHDPQAEVGPARQLHTILGRFDETTIKPLITRLRSLAGLEATPCTYHPGLVREHVGLNKAANTWVWKDGGDQQPIRGFGDAVDVDLAACIAGNQVTRLGLNQQSGSPKRVIGFLARSEWAYAGVEGNSLQLVVPCEPGKSQAVVVAVEHHKGYGVYGLTVARKLRERGGRVVPFTGSPRRLYFITADGAFAINGIS